MTTHELLLAAKAAAPALAWLGSEEKNAAILRMADAIVRETDVILAANEADVQAAKGTISDVMLDRLRLTQARIAAMADGMRQVSALPDPVGEVLAEVRRPNGLVICKTAVPLGVVAIIYESRPNVTSDAAVLAMKSGNVCVLRGGKVAQGVANHQHIARRIALGRKRRKAGLLGACVLAQNDVHMLDKAVARPFFRQSLAVGAGNNGGVRQHMDRRQGLSAAGKRPRIIAHGGDGRVDGAAPFQRFLQARAAAGRNGFLQRRV